MKSILEYIYLVFFSTCLILFWLTIILFVLIGMPIVLFIEIKNWCMGIKKIENPTKVWKVNWCCRTECEDCPWQGNGPR